MESNARLAMLLRRLQEQQQLDELNDYEDDDDDEYEENGNHQHGDSEEDVGDRDVDELEEEFARAAFGDLVIGGGNNHAKNSATRSGKELEEEKLLEMLQRRLFPSASFSAEKNRSMFPASGKLARSSRRPASSSVWSPSTDDTTTAQRKPYATRKSSTQQQRQHQALGFAVDSPSISPEKINKMVHRFRLQEEKAARKLRAKREEAESKEKTGFTFAPSLDSKSRRLTGAMPKFMERQAKLLARKRHQKDWYEQLQEEERTRDRALDLEAHVKTPCICSRGNTARSSDCSVAAGSPSRKLATGAATPKVLLAAGQMHTKSCLRFMEICNKMNHSCAIQRKKDQMKRSIDDMMAYHEEKQQRQHARAEIARAQEATETTFTPQINPRSEKIYAELVRSGRLQSELTERMLVSRKATPTVPKLSFQPTISKRSKALLQKKKERKASSRFVPGMHDDDGHPSDADEADVFLRLHKQHSIRGGDGTTNPPGSCELDSTQKGNLSPPAAVEWNVIEYDQVKHGFILENFDLDVLMTS